MKNNEVYTKGAELLILGLKVSKPDLTDEQAKKVIINVGNWLQLQELSDRKK